MLKTYSPRQTAYLRRLADQLVRESATRVARSPAGATPDRVPAWQWIAENFVVPDADTLQARPFIVFPWVARVLLDILPDDEAHLPYQLVVYSTVKKSGKTALNGAIHANLMFNRAPAGAELYTFANSKEQSTGRVFKAVRYAVEASPGLMGRCRDVLETIIRMANGTTLTSMAAMHANIAGANPYASGWTELWGYEHEKEMRAWHEMTPPPTIRDSMRIVDTYAGYEGESGLLNRIEDQAKAAGRLHTDGYELPPEYRSYARALAAADPELATFLLPPRDRGRGPVRYPDPLPVYVDEAARLYAFWDEGEGARRMPWQSGERGRRYYAAQASDLDDNAFSRLHLNKRSRRGGQFCDMTTWRARGGVEPWKPGDPDVIFLAGDTAMRSDHMALVGTRIRGGRPEICFVQDWAPAPDERAGGKRTIDPAAIIPALESLAMQGMVIALWVYDPYQFHAVALELSGRGFTVREFEQGTPRLEADTALWRRIRDGGIAHCDNPHLDAAVEAADAVQSPGPTGDRMRLRIVKGSGKVDALVAASMSVWAALEIGGARWEVYDDDDEGLAPHDEGEE